MFSRHRRLAGASVALAVMVTVAAATRQAEPPVHIIRVTLGLKDKEPADWSGKVTVADGEVSALAGWRFDPKETIEGTTGWKCGTHNYIAPEKRYPLLPASGKPQPADLQPWPNGVTLTLRGAAPSVTLKLPAGEVKFKAAELLFGEPKLFLDAQVRVERMPATALLRPPALPKTENAVQDDYPAFWVRYRTGKQYLAWVAYQKEKDRVLLVERDGPEGKWSEPIEVDGPGDHFRVALASTHDDTLWVVWSSQREHQWNLFGRPYKDGKLGAEVRLSEGPGPSRCRSAPARRIIGTRASPPTTRKTASGWAGTATIDRVTTST